MSIAVQRRSASGLPAPRRRADGWDEALRLARATSQENRRCARRVRHEARDALAVVLFSATASTLLSIVVAAALSWAA